jgi:superfamily II DNA or RNA helicase
MELLMNIACPVLDVPPAPVPRPHIRHETGDWHLAIPPRDYQLGSADDATAFAVSGDKKRCYAAPTGSGKSIIELEILARHPHAVLVTPRVEIITDMLTKLGLDRDWLMSLSEVDRWEIAAEHRLWTPVRLRNRLRSGAVSLPSLLILDEVHHSLALSYTELRLLGNCPVIGFTASPWRGTPRSTHEFLQFWGEPHWIITIAEAAARKLISLPTITIKPLVDDDTIDVSSSGEFTVTSANDTTGSRLQALVALIRSFYGHSLWDRPTMVSLPSTEICRQAHELLDSQGIPAVVVTAETSAMDRQTAFQRTINRETVLLQISVVGEGIDLPLRRLIDAQPTMSPVKWLQCLGRITRPVGPGEVAPEYVVTNRNLERHAYVLDGIVPPRKIAEAQNAFGTASKRTTVRVLGLEGLGRFKATEVPLLGGARGSMYTVQHVVGHEVHQLVALCHPCSAEPLYATRTNVRNGDGTIYGRWQRLDNLPEITGAWSVSDGVLSEKQALWWQRAAAGYGLDPRARVGRRAFTALPVLSDLGLKMESN